MKKSILLFVCLGLILIGCSSTSDVTTNSKMDEASEVMTLCSVVVDSNEESILFVSLGDRVLSYKDTMVIDTTTFKETSIDEFIERYISLTKSLKGVKYEYSINGSIINQSLFVDFKEADLQELRKASLVMVDSKATYLSLKEYTQQLESIAGYKCVLQQ